MTRRRRTQRLRRVDEVLRQIVSSSLLELGEGRTAGVVVTGVEASPDVAYADVFVQIPGPHERQAKVLEALDRVRPPIQARINEEMHLRLTPVLRFVVDETFERAMRIERLLAEHPPMTPAPEDADGAEGGADG